MGKKRLTKYASTLKEALETFDLKVLKEWMEKWNKPLYSQFIKANETVQMATMCKMICNRTDLLGTEVYMKAVKWLTEHNMSGRLY